MRAVMIGLFSMTMFSIPQPAQAADCEGWWWQKIVCLQKRVAELEQGQAALQKELREMPQRFAAQITAVEVRLNKKIDGTSKDITSQVTTSLRRGVKLRNGKEDTCIFSDNLGVGGFRKCSNDEREVWLLQGP